MNNNYKRILAFSIAIMLSTGVISAFANNENPHVNLEAVGISEINKEIQLGTSGSDNEVSETDGNIPKLTHSDVLFQFRENGTLEDENLELEIYLTGDINSVKMKTSANEEEKKTITDDEIPSVNNDYLLSDNLAYSLEEESEPIKIVPNANLGYSVNIAEVKSDKVLESDTSVSFDLSDAGEYTFGLYDSESNLVADLLYNTRTELPGEIAIKVGSGFLIVADNLHVTVDYVVPVSDITQKFIVTIPPFYTLSGTPAAQNGITYKNSILAFNPAHYESVPFGNKLIEYSQTMPASDFRQSVLEVSLANNISGKISFTLTISSSSTQKQRLSDAMAYFAENPDKVPLLIVAEAKNAEGTIFNSATFEGNSTLTDTVGNPVNNTISFPDNNVFKTPSPYLRILAPTATINSVNYPRLSAPHYPYSDVVRLFPYVEDSVLATNETLITIDGKKYMSVPQDAYAFRYFSREFSIGLTAYNLKLPAVNYLKPSSLIPAGPVYLEYTYMGERVREVEFQLNDFPMAAPMKPFSEIYYRSVSGSSWTTSSTNSYHVQGKKNQQFKIEVANSSTDRITSTTQLLLPMVYKDVELRFEIPFEFTLKDIDYLTSAPYSNHPLLKQMKPYKVDYTTFEGGAGTIPVPTDSNKITIPEGTGHISQLFFYYDLWVYNIDNTFITTVDIGTTRENGSSIPNSQAVYIRTHFNTTGRNMVELYDTVNAADIPFTGISKALLVNLVAEEDGVRFGTYSDTSNTQKKGSFYTSLRAYNETSTGLSAGNNITFSDGQAPWMFAFKSTVSQSKDYENVKIIIEANNESEAKALSKMGGMQTGLIRGTNVSQYEIFIKTNLYPEGKVVTSPTGIIYNVLFNLLDNEYVTYVEIRLGTLYGSSFLKGGSLYDIGEKIYPASGQITPSFRDDRYYFKGTDKEELIRDGETQHLVARVETSSDAKYMDPNSPDYFNSTSTATMFFIPYVDVDIESYKTLSADWSAGNTFYQGTPFTFSLNPTLYYYINGATYPNSSYTGMTFPSYDHRIYLELAEGFEITSVAGYDFVEKKTLPDTNTALFVFESSPQALGGRIYFTGYVRPDAPVSNNIKLFENFGFDFQSFKEKHLQPDTGDNAYYNSEPYHKVDFIPTPFPTSWGLNGATDAQLSFNLHSNNTINTNRANLDKVVLNALVNGTNQVASANFYDHQKAQLSAQGWMTNISDSNMHSYRAKFHLPRVGNKIQGGQINGNDTFFDSEFNLYLSDAISFPSGLDNPVVVYFAGDGRELNPTSPSEWKEVESIQITFDNFAAHQTVGITLPLITDYNKLGKELQILKAYIGAASSKKNVVGEDFSVELYTDPISYNFLSYTLSTRIGIDQKETGQLDAAANHVGIVNVYYEENGEEHLLYSSYMAYNTITLNKDATRIEIVPFAEHYKLSLEKGAGILESRNSDFPRDTGSMPILLDDLINRTPYKYDATFIYIPTLSATNIVLREGESAVSLPIISILNSASPVDRYSKGFSVENPLTATIEQDGTITGLKAGETTYTYTVNNLFGDEFVITKTITVLKKVVPTAIFQKTLPDGPINANDQFSFDIWSASDKSDLTTVDLSVVSNSTDLGGFFLPGTKYFVEETVYDSGYSPKELEISYTTSTGSVSETFPVTNATATFTVHSDAEGMNMSFVNDSKRYSLNMEKMLLPLNENHDFTQEFPITVRDNVTDEIVFDSSLKGDGTQLVLSELIPNRSYTITEVKAGYDLLLIEVVNPLGIPTGVTQPVRADENSFVLTVDSTLEGGTIIVKNEPVDKGNLRIVHVPNLDFGAIVNGETEKRLRTEDVYLSIWDSRVVRGDWRLSVSASDMTTTLNDGRVHILPYHGLMFSSGASTPVLIEPTSTVTVIAGTTKNNVPLQTETWLATADDRITFQSKNIDTFAGDYQSTLTWSLVSAP